MKRCTQLYRKWNWLVRRYTIKLTLWRTLLLWRLIILQIQEIFCIFMLITWLRCWQDPVNPILSQINAFHDLPSDFFKICFNTIFTSVLKSSNWSLTLLNPMLHIYRYHIKMSDYWSTYFLMRMLPAARRWTTKHQSRSLFIYGRQHYHGRAWRVSGVVNGYLPFYERSNHCGCNLDMTKSFLYWII